MCEPTADRICTITPDLAHAILARAHAGNGEILTGERGHAVTVDAEYGAHWYRHAAGCHDRQARLTLHLPTSEYPEAHWHRVGYIEYEYTLAELDAAILPIPEFLGGGVLAFLRSERQEIVEQIRAMLASAAE